MDELIARLEKLQQQWYANEVDSDEFAYEVFAIKDSLSAYSAHFETCPMLI